MNKLKIVSQISRFSDNALIIKQSKICVFHWTGSNSINGTLDWLDNRCFGSGSVAYHFIIDTNGIVHELCDLHHFFHNTGKGFIFDSKVISIAFVSKGEFPNNCQITACNLLLNKKLRKVFDFTEYRCHRELNDKKPDFPDDYWEKLQRILEY